MCSDANQKRTLCNENIQNKTSNFKHMMEYIEGDRRFKSVRKDKQNSKSMDKKNTKSRRTNKNKSKSPTPNI